MPIRWPWKNEPDPSPAVSRQTRTEPDGTRVETVEVRLGADNLRPVRDEVVEALDAALASHGELLHAIDPARLVRFEDGGPPVWSVGCLRIEGERPYWLFVTYGFSHAVSPEPSREPYAHEFSLAVPVGVERAEIWGPALLRHLSRYVLRSGADLQVGDNMPLGVSVNRVAFQPEHHAMFRDSRLGHVVVAADPLLGVVDTPAGAVAIRRIYALDPDEAAQLDVWSATSLMEEVLRIDPLLLTDLDRPCLLADDAVRARWEARAREEGGSVGQLFVEGGWTDEGDHLLVHLPGGAQARQVRRVIEARLPYGRPVILVGPPGVRAIRFDAAPTFAMHPVGDLLLVYGPLADPGMQQVLAAIDPDGEGTTLRLSSV